MQTAQWHLTSSSQQRRQLSGSPRSTGWFRSGQSAADSRPPGRTTRLQHQRAAHQLSQRVAAPNAAMSRHAAFREAADNPSQPLPALARNCGHHPRPALRAAHKASAPARTALSSQRAAAPELARVGVPRLSCQSAAAGSGRGDGAQGASPGEHRSASRQHAAYLQPPLAAARTDCAVASARQHPTAPAAQWIPSQRQRAAATDAEFASVCRAQAGRTRSR